MSRSTPKGEALRQDFGQAGVDDLALRQREVVAGPHDRQRPCLGVEHAVRGARIADRAHTLKRRNATEARRFEVRQAKPSLGASDVCVWTVARGL